MKKTIILSLALMATLAGQAATRTTMADKTTKLDTLVVSTNPQMHCSGCENKIRQNIRFVKGTKKIFTSVPEQKVTIVYDKQKADMKTYTEAFNKIGFKIKVIKK